jgi:hypothetical protein
MSVHKKLMQARIKLQGTQLKKSGLNKFAGYSYFELGDFLPEIQNIFNDVGLCGVISYDITHATLCITDVEDGTQIVITSPMAEANLKGTHPIQNLGAVETYQRRYLWMTAMEIVEHDILDATTGSEAPAKPVVRAIARNSGEKAEEKQPAVPAVMEGADAPWSLKVTAKPSTDVEAWCSLVIDMARLGLTQCGSEADVMAIFKVNRAIFDHLKVSDSTRYEELMAEFKTARSTFKKAA